MVKLKLELEKPHLFPRRYSYAAECDLGLLCAGSDNDERAYRNQIIQDILKFLPTELKDVAFLYHKHSVDPGEGVLFDYKTILINFSSEKNINESEVRKIFCRALNSAKELVRVKYKMLRDIPNRDYSYARIRESDFDFEFR